MAVSGREGIITAAGLVSVSVNFVAKMKDTNLNLCDCSIKERAIKAIELIL